MDRESAPMREIGWNVAVRFRKRILSLRRELEHHTSITANEATKRGRSIEIAGTIENHPRQGLTAIGTP